MQIAGRRFAPPWWGIVLAIAASVLFVRLGFWQLDRAEEKRQLLEAYRRGADHTVPLTRDNVERLVRFQQVEVRGRYDGARQILLDNMGSNGPDNGLPGYHVWTLLHLEQGGAVLVNRGFVPLTDSRKHLPSVPVDDHLRTIVGRLNTLPEPAVRLAPTVPQGTWPEVLYYPEVAQLTHLLGEPIPPRIVLLDPHAADGYERIWQFHSDFGPEQHIAYAAQWFAFTVAAGVIFLLVNLKKPVTPT
jgi:surfeit locus 1 family protein